MSEASVSAAGAETRQSMIRVWLAISAVWVAFWLMIALIALATVEVRFSLAPELGPFSLIVLLPPLALFGVGAVGRWILDATAKAFVRFRRPKQQPRIGGSVFEVD
jgi:hypothetical protein